MALFNSKKKTSFKPTPKKQPMSTMKMVAIGIGVVVVIVILYFALFFTNQSVVSAPATVNITQAGTIFAVNGQEFLISLASSSGGTAYVHVSKLPIFLSPLLNVTLTLNNITKVNAGSSYADIGVQLLSAGTGSITVKITPLASSLQISPDSSLIHVIPSSLYAYGQGASTTIKATTTISTTTISGSATTAASTSTTTGSTTTVSSINTTALDISNALVQNEDYGLLLNFSTLYTNTSKCTSTQYNTSYANFHGSVARPPNDYANVSQFVPYNMSSTVVSAGKGNYSVVFRTKTQSSLFNNEVASTIGVNASTKSVLNVTFASTGAYEGLNYTSLHADYVRAIGIGGACGVFI
jgi:hypothetical protein